MYLGWKNCSKKKFDVPILQNVFLIIFIYLQIEKAYKKSIIIIKKR